MGTDLSSFSRAFAPRVMQKAIQAFDTATVVIVGSCWGGAIVIMLFALYTLNMSVTAKRQVIEAAAAEPALPRMVTRPPELSELKPITERLQKRFPEIGFTLGTDKSLAVTAQQGPKFRTWLTVLSYIDTISPQYRWQIKEFCVGGQCSASVPMKAVLIAQKISFATTPVNKD